jgi:hypothetical protein
MRVTIGFGLLFKAALSFLFVNKSIKNFLHKEKTMRVNKKNRKSQIVENQKARYKTAPTSTKTPSLVSLSLKPDT